MCCETMELPMYELYRRANMMTHGKSYVESVEHFLKILNEYESKLSEFDRLALADAMLNVLAMILTSVRGWAGWYFSIRFANEYLTKDDMLRDIKKMIEITRQLLTYDLERTKEWLRKFEEKKAKEESSRGVPQSI